MRMALCVSLKKDPDLFFLLEALGKDAFRDVVRLSLAGLSDDAAAQKAQALAYAAACNGRAHAIDAPDGFVKLLVGLEGERYSVFEELCKRVRPGLKGSFTKTIVRQVLGPSATVAGFLEEGEGASDGVTFAPNATVVLIDKEPSKSAPKPRTTKGEQKKKREKKTQKRKEIETRASVPTLTHREEPKPKPEPQKPVPESFGEPLADSKGNQEIEQEIDILSMLETMM